jgi:hypothetical protein
MRWKYIYGKTWHEVSDQLKADQHAQQQGLPIVVERQTVAEFMTRWLEDSAHPRVRPKTYDSYAQIVRLYIEPDLGHIQLSKLSPPGDTAAPEQDAQERAVAAHREILPCSSTDGTGASV